MDALMPDHDHFFLFRKALYYLFVGILLAIGICWDAVDWIKRKGGMK